MSEFSYDCPHCLTKNVGFEVSASKENPHEPRLISAFALCKNCGRAVVFYCQSTGQISGRAEQLSGQIFFQAFRVLYIWPEPKRPDIPANLPPSVLKRIVETEAAFTSASMPMLIGIGLRGIVEAAVKNLHPEATGSLYKRIEAMKDLLPDSLIKLLHAVRIFGNDSAHDLPDVEMTPAEMQAEVVAVRELVRLFLTYAYELPARVASAEANQVQG